MSKRRHSNKPRETAASVAFDQRAPATERRDAQEELQKGHMPTSSEMINAANFAPMLEYIQRQQEEAEFSKAFSKQNVIQLPSRAAQKNEPGMQSVRLDDLQVSTMGDYYEKPSIFTFDSMRAMVDQTPVLSAVIMTRIRQVMRFARLTPDGKAPGYRIAMDDHTAHATPTEEDSQRFLGKFFKNCGWEDKPRLRTKLRRDDFAGFLSKFVRDSLTLDSAPIELEWKRDRTLGLDGMYAVDGATIRLCTESGYRGDDEIFAVQVVQGQLRAAYTRDDLIYVPRNPRSNVSVGGYGLSETELLVRTVTGFLNAFTYNTKYFDSNAIPRGMMNLYGNYDDKDIIAFKRYWNSMVKGVDNSWALPVMVSKDAESKAEFSKFDADVDEMMFGKWMTFLTSLICAIYGMAPDEINFESFTTGSSSLSGNDTEEKIINSKDKGLRPLLAYVENTLTDFVVAEYDSKYCFRFTGLDNEDATQLFERQKLTSTVNEMRARDDLPKVTEKWGDAPLNPILVPLWQQENMPEQQDFGQPGAQGQPGEGGEQPGDPSEIPGASPNFGEGQDGGEPQGNDFGGEQMGKSFGLPVYKLEV